MVTQAQETLGPANVVPVSVDYRARAAIRQLSAEDQAAVLSAIDALARYGLHALAGAGPIRHVAGLRVGDGRGPVYEMRVPGASGLRIFFITAEEDGRRTFVVTDVLRLRALRNAAQSF